MKCMLLFLLVLFVQIAQAGDVVFNGTKPDIIIDVRTPEEFMAGHIDGAVNIHLDQLGMGIKAAGKKSSILVYCRSGHRSSLAKAQLEQMGYSRILNGGGITTMTGQLKPCGPKNC